MELVICLALGILALFLIFPYTKRLRILKGVGADMKMVLVVRMDLKMGKGKIAAQCCHAAIGLFERQGKHNVEAIAAWKRDHCKKVVLKCKDENELMEIAEAARNEQLGYYLVCDAGLTQISPGSKTVLAVGPASEDHLSKVTSHLRLL